MPSMFMTADTHFGDPNALKYRHRPFDDVEHMNDVIVENWNSIVAPDDWVWHLGDFAVTDEALEACFPRLNGEIHLLMGNHERIRDRRFLETFFSSVVEEPFELDVEADDGRKETVWMCHYPLQRHSTLYSVTGHVHSAWQVAYRMLNIGVDVWHFRPVPMNWVLDMMDVEQNGHWDANVYPDAQLALRWMMSSKIRRDASEPTMGLLEEETRRSAML